MEVCDTSVPQSHGFELGARRNLCAHIEARQDVFSVVFSARGIPSSLLVAMRGFGPGDLVSRILGFLHERDGYRFESRSLLSEDSDPFLERARDIRGKHLRRSEEHTSELQSRENLVC